MNGFKYLFEPINIGPAPPQGDRPDNAIIDEVPVDIAGQLKR